MPQFTVTVKRLNKRRAVPVNFPDRENIIGEVKEGFTFEGEEASITEVPNIALGKWYKDRDNSFYWGAGLTATPIIVPVAEPVLPAQPSQPSAIGWGLQKLHIKDFWHAAGNKGATVTIAVIDTGISSSHPEFDYAKISRFNVLKNDDTIAEDVDGHGTHVAGIIAAKGIKVTGVAQDVNLLIIKIAETVNSWLIENVAAGIQHAIDAKVDIISISGEFDEDNSKLGLLKEKVDLAEKKGITVVASAGNNFNSFPVESFPAAFDVCLSIGSIKEDGTRGDSSSHSTKLDVVAPGEQILSTWTGSGYRIESGTSMAAPFAAATVAVLKSFARTKLQQELSPAQIQVVINKSADDAGDLGIDTSYGFGIINPLKALKSLTN